MLHIRLCYFLIMVQGLDGVLDLSFSMTLWCQLHQMSLLHKMPLLCWVGPTSIRRACPMHVDRTSWPSPAQLRVRQCRPGISLSKPRST